MRARVLSVIAAGALVLSGCGDTAEPNTDTTQAAPTVAAEDAKSTSIDAIDVSGEPGAQPEVAFAAPLVIEDSAREVVSEGDGDAVADKQQVSAHMTLVSGSTGELVESSYEADTPAGFPMDTAQISQELYDAIIDVPVGSRVLFTLNGAAMTGAQTETLVYVVDVVSAEEPVEPLARAEGTPVEPEADLPKVTLDESGKPSLEKPSGDAPTELVVQPLIEGDGPEVKAGQTVSTHYSGWLWSDGSQFDSSWERGEPFAVENVGDGPVITGWNEALVGQKVGSQLLVVIPPDKGYGDVDNGAIPAGSTLVFVMDILSAVG